MRLYLFLRVILRRKFGTALRYFEEMRDHFTKQPRFVWDVLIQSLARDFRVGPALELLVWLRDRSRRYSYSCNYNSKLCADSLPVGGDAEALCACR
jgi:hypothetical protein